MTVRRARDTDLVGVAAILNREIASNFAHFGTEPMTEERLHNELKAAGEKCPWFVAETADGRILGVARASPWKSRGGYAWTVEIGVYVAPDAQGKGIGTALYEALFPAMRRAGIRTVLAGIALPNDSSVRLHERFGMAHAGTLPKAGFKLGQWRDVGYWALHWGEGPPTAGASDDLS
jgi:phosphinothricin acetyltransferase